MFKESADGEVCVKYSRLSVEDIPQISRLLMSVWSKNYGVMGFPMFREDYLHWLFGGPNKDKHILMGGKIENEVVAYLSALYRRIFYSGKLLNGYLYTHITIFPHLTSQVRFGALLEMINQIQDNYFSPECDLIYGFSEEKKVFRENLIELGGKFTKINVKNVRHITFNQFLVGSNKVRKYLQDNFKKEKSYQIRMASESDYPVMAGLFNKMRRNNYLMLQMTEVELKHHFSGHPDHRTFVIESDGGIEAFNNYYPIEIVKADGSYKYVIIEFLISENPNKDHITALLKETIDFGEEIGAKGVVIENASYLDYDTYKTLGLMATLRRMIMSISLKNSLIDNLDGFMCDVK